MFECDEVDPLWKEALDAKEKALRVRSVKYVEKLGEHSKPLEKLKVGDHVFVQNQTGRNSSKWEKSGIVTEEAAYDKYSVKVDGSGRVTDRNQRVLRAFRPDLIQPPQERPFPFSMSTNSSDKDQREPTHHAGVQVQQLPQQEVQQQGFRPSPEGQAQ